MSPISHPEPASWNVPSLKTFLHSSGNDIQFLSGFLHCEHSSDAKTQIEDIVMETPRTSPGVETVWRFLRTKLAGVNVDTAFSDLFVYLRIGRRARAVC